MTGKVYIVNQEYKAQYKVFFETNNTKKKIQKLLRVANLQIQKVRLISKSTL